MFFGINYVTIYIIYKYANFVCESFVLQDCRVLQRAQETQLCKGESIQVARQHGRLKSRQGHQGAIPRKNYICNVNTVCHHSENTFNSNESHKKEESMAMNAQNATVRRLGLEVPLYNMGITWKICLRGAQQSHTCTHKGQRVRGTFIMPLLQAVAFSRAAPSSHNDWGCPKYHCH